MRNLNVRTEWTVEWKSQLDPASIAAGNSHPGCCHVDLEGNILIVLDRQLHRLEMRQGEGAGLHHLAEFEPNLGRCVRLADLGDGTVAAAFEGGSLWRVDLLGAAAGGNPTQEEVGAVEDGLVELSSSPDDELLVLITCKGKLVLMNREFEPIRDIELDQGGFGEGEFVNVGWGKKETQFHGRMGKAAALDQGEAAGAAQLLSEGDDGTLRVDWRNDGEFFAVTYVAAETSDTPAHRVIRVYNREGTLQATSEKVRGLEHNLSWKPQGTSIATTVRSLSKYEVAFFEKNGLRHGGFTLDLGKEASVSSLAWSSTSDVLLVAVRSEKSHSVRAYTCSNYNWSLKQSWTDLTSPIIHLQWDPVRNLRFHAMEYSGSLRTVLLGWEVSRSGEGVSPALAELDQGLVVRADGCQALATPFRSVVVPPPMAAFQLSVPTCVEQIAFTPSGNTVLVTRSELFVFGHGPAPAGTEIPESVSVKLQGGLNGFKPSYKVPQFLAKWTIAQDLGKARLCNWCLLKNDVLLAARGQFLHVLRVMDGKEVARSDEFSCEDDIVAVCRDASGTTGAVQLQNGTVLRYTAPSGENDGRGQLVPWETPEGEWLKSSSPYANMAIVTVPGGDCSRTQVHLLVGLSGSHRLFLDGSLVCSDASSFFIHTDFILLIDLKHQLRTFPLASLSPDNPVISWTNESVRSVERGSKLVMAVPGSSAVVLQMPRGNLEVVHPRSLSLAIVGRLLDGGQYREAGDRLRRHRINLNLLVDHDPAKFLDGVAEFLDQFDDPSRLCLLIADLQDEDCTRTTYSSSYPSRRGEAAFSWPGGTGKTDAVCTALMAAMEARENEVRFLLPILSCLVKRSGSDVTKALLRVQAVRGRDQTLAEEALGFLAVLVDVNKLFNVALGTYDFDLVLFVAEKSQKDPKEYLPFLNQLKVLPEQYRRYKINLHLKRNIRALENLSNAEGDHDEEILELVKSQRLFKDALRLFPKGSGRMFAPLCCAYGEYLETKKYYEDAALVFADAGMLRQSLANWERCLDWRRCLAAAGAARLDPTELSGLRDRLAERLSSDGRAAEAATVLLEGAREEEAVAALVAGGCWAEAERLIEKLERKDLYDTHYLPSAMESASAALVAYSGDLEALSGHLSRFRAVVEARRKVSGAGQGGAGGEDPGLEGAVMAEDSDLYSDTTSVGGRTISDRSSTSSRGTNPASLRTRVTQRSKSSKNRRKNEKKKYSTREGSVHEDIGLVAEIHKIITRTYKSVDQTGELLRTLFRLEEKSLASRVQASLGELLVAAKSAEAEVWSVEAASGESCGSHMYGPNATVADIVAFGGVEAETHRYNPPFHLLEPIFRIPPQIRVNDSWRLLLLS